MTDATETASSATLRRPRTALLTTFRRSGDPVSTPVSIALHADSAYFVTAASSGKALRLARCNRVSLAPCTVSGVPTGATVAGHARLVEDAARRRVRRLLRPAGPLFWSYLLYRVRGNTMHLYEVTFDVPDPATTASPAS